MTDAEWVEKVAHAARRFLEALDWDESAVPGALQALVSVIDGPPEEEEVVWPEPIAERIPVRIVRSYERPVFHIDDE